MSKPRCLLIEDDEALAGLWMSYLEQAGISVEAVMKINDGMEAFARIPHPDLVILDLRLPDSNNAMDTLDFVPKMRAIHPQAMILTATGYASPELAQKAIRVGVDAFLDKCEMGTQRGCIDAIMKFLRRPTESSKDSAEGNLTLIERLTKNDPAGP